MPPFHRPFSWTRPAAVDQCDRGVPADQFGTVHPASGDACRDSKLASASETPELTVLTLIRNDFIIRSG